MGACTYMGARTHTEERKLKLQQGVIETGYPFGYKTIMIDDNRSQSPVNMPHLGRLVVHLESIRTPSIPHSTSMSSAFCHREVDVWPQNIE